MVKHNNQWGTVCDDYFLKADGQQDRVARNFQSACYTLGFSGGSTESYTYSGSEPMMVDNVYCASGTMNFLSCTRSSWGKHNCDKSEHILLTCT